MVEEGFGLPVEDGLKLKKVFSDYPNIRKVIIYGSRAKGNYKPGSDIDLTIVGQLSWDEFHQLEFDLEELMLPYRIDLSLQVHIDNPELIDHIKRVGKAFYTM